MAHPKDAHREQQSQDGIQQLGRLQREQEDESQPAGAGRRSGPNPAPKDWRRLQPLRLVPCPGVRRLDWHSESTGAIGLAVPHRLIQSLVAEDWGGKWRL